MRSRIPCRSLLRTAIYAFLLSSLLFPTSRLIARAASTISLRSTATGTNGAGSTQLSLAQPAGIQPGDVLIAQVVVNASSTVITPPPGWSLIRTVKSSSSVEQATYYKVVSASEPASYAWTFGASQPATGGIAAFAGVDTASPIDTSSGKYNASTATAGFTQVTTTASSEMLLALLGVSGNTTVTPPAGFGEDYDVKNTASTNGKTTEMSHQLLASAGLTAVGSGKEDTLSASNLTQLIALRPLGSAPTAAPSATSTRTPTPISSSTATPTFTAGPTFTPTLVASPSPTSAAAIFLRATVTGANGTGATSLTIASPTGTQSGDVLIAQVVVNTASTVINPPPGWNLIRTVKSSSSVEQATFYRVAAATEPASYTWTLSASQPATGGIANFAGVDTANPIDASSGKYNASTATASFNQITTTGPNEMLLAMVGVSGNTTVTAPAGFAEVYDANNTGSASGKTAEMSHQFTSAAGLTAVGNGKEDTLSASNLTQLIALRAAGSPTAVPTFTSTPTNVPAPTSTFTPTQVITATATSTAAPSATPTATAPPTPTSSPAPGDLTLAVVGDMQCASSTCQNAHTSDLVVQMNPNAYLPLGDLVENGAYANFLNYYDPLWGRFRAIAFPVIGNHEGDGNGYYDYWNGVGAATGPVGTRGKGWYSFNLGTWHFVALNSNCVADSLKVDCQPGSEEIAWLNADLDVNPAQCTIAYMHHPYYSSGSRQYPELKTIFQTLYDHKVELYFSGHDHYYQRFYPQDANSNRDDANGVTEFVVGTGGGTLAGVSSTSNYKNQAVQIGRTFGVIRLALHPGSYDFQFLPAQGYTATDSGSGTCH